MAVIEWYAKMAYAAQEGKRGGFPKEGGGHFNRFDRKTGRVEKTTGK